MCVKCWNRCRDWSDFKTLAQDCDRQLKAEVGEKDLDQKDVLMCGDTVLIKLELENDDVKTEAGVEIVKGDKLIEAVFNEEEQLDEEERNLDTIEPLANNPLDDGIVKTRKGRSKAKGRKHREKKQTTRDGPSQVKTTGPHKCPCCSRGFSKLSNLKTHERIHTNERPFQCEECGATFKQIFHLTGHKLTHSGVRAFECDECHKKFTQKCAMVRHKQLHTNERPFKCHLCESKFKHIRYLTFHLKNTHK